jgi:hypothetical protein
VLRTIELSTFQNYYVAVGKYSERIKFDFLSFTFHIVVYGNKQVDITVNKEDIVQHKDTKVT